MWLWRMSDPDRRSRPKNLSDTHKTPQLKKLPETDITNTVWDNSLSQRLEDSTNMAIQSDGGEWVLQEHK